MVHEIGRYDFDEFPKSGLWNTSYGLLAWTFDMPTHQFKSVCREADASPLAYADCSPAPILNVVRDKGVVRQAVPESEVRAHVRRVFSYEETTPRLGLVILSGVSGPEWTLPRELIRAECLARGIPVLEVPFFYPTNTAKIRAAVSDDDRRLIGRLLDGFGAVQRAASAHDATVAPLPSPGSRGNGSRCS
ncbi:MAG: hypothetical protein GEU80_03955 [Dehalococcoidia bacterium]|nr:hypothetical protein [Dehalococcoidia bacterium]